MLLVLLLAQVPKSEVRIEVKDGFRMISSNGIPDHETGRFPNRGNPNAIAAQDYHFQVPVKPNIAEKPVALSHQDFGIALNGVPFDPFTAEFWNNQRGSEWNYEAIIQGQGMLGIDINNAHVQPNGAYHYHANPVGLMKSRGADGTKMVQIGWAADGYPMYGLYGYAKANDAKSSAKLLVSSWRLKKGSRSGGPGGVYDGSFTSDWEYVKGTGDLDECNGRFGVTPEFPTGTYYYVVTKDYPWIPRWYHGVPDRSFERRRPGGQRPGGPRPGGQGPRRGGPPESA